MTNRFLTKSTKLIILLVLIPFTNVLFAQNVQSEIDDLLTKYNDYRLFNGSALVGEKGKVVLQKSYGLANMELDVPNKAKTKFRIGSITKQFTAAIIMKLHEEGKINFTDKLSDHLPYYKKEIGDKVTIHQLLIHTSGIPSYTGLPELRDFIQKNYPVKEFIEKFCSNDFEFEPGSDFKYNNTGYFLLGAIIEELTGSTYTEALQEYILDPLEMKDTGYDLHNTIIHDRASGYSKTYPGYRNADYVDMSWPYAAGAMYSTTSDMFKWHNALNTTELLSDKSKEIMFSPSVPAFGGHYAYGWIIAKVSFNGTDSLTLIQHGGDINGFSSLITRIKETDQVVILLNNFMGFARSEITNNIFKILSEEDITQPKKSIADYLTEAIETDGIHEAIISFNELKDSEEFDLYYTSENEINTLGYAYMGKGQLDEAIKIFQLNIDQFPKSFNTYDSMGEAQLLNGNKEKGIEFYKKSIEINPGNENGITVLKDLGIEIEEKVIIIPEEVLESYVGIYELQPNFKIDVTKVGKELFVQATGQPKFPLFSKNETEFYLKVVNAQVHFVLEDDEVKSLILYQGGREMVGKKL